MIICRSKLHLETREPHFRSVAKVKISLFFGAASKGSSSRYTPLLISCGGNAVENIVMQPGSTDKTSAYCVRPSAPISSADDIKGRKHSIDQQCLPCAFERFCPQLTIMINSPTFAQRKRTTVHFLCLSLALYYISTSPVHSATEIRRSFT